MASNRFYMACFRDNVGTNVSFHAKNGKGYTTDLDKAEVLTREQAQNWWNGAREFEMPLCADRIDKLAVFHVDCQYIPCESEKAPAGESYVAFKKGSWDGNDVYWVTEMGGATTDFSKAFVTTYRVDLVSPNVVIIPFKLADEVKRRTFNERYINRRKMVQAAGLITPPHVKRARRRKGDSNKVRMNCPSCGRIHWQYNPYDFNGCSNLDCDQFSIHANS